MKFIQQEGHVLQPDTMMPPEVQLTTDPEMWIVSIYQNKTVSFLCFPEQNEDEVQNAYTPPGTPESLKDLASKNKLGKALPLMQKGCTDKEVPPSLLLQTQPSAAAGEDSSHKCQ